MTTLRDDPYMLGKKICSFLCVYVSTSRHNKKSREPFGFRDQDGDYLLSHLRSTIGVTKLNFSVRNGKRWNLRAIVT